MGVIALENLIFIDFKKSRIRETPTLSTDADSGTNTNLKRKRDLSKKELKKIKKGGGRYTLRPKVSNPLGSVVSTMFCKAKSAKNKLFFKAAILDHFLTKNVQF